jgi:hypothetical protein
MADSAEIALRNRQSVDSSAPRTSGGPKTVYLNRTDYSSTTEPPRYGGGSGRLSNALSRAGNALGTGATKVQVQKPAPQFLGNQQVVVYAWMASLAVIAVDEWHSHHILPRPSRLWWASLFYGMLALGGMGTMLIPLMNALAIGYLFFLIWQFYNGEGQFNHG